MKIILKCLRLYLDPLCLSSSSSLSPLLCSKTVSPIDSKYNLHQNNFKGTCKLHDSMKTLWCTLLFKLKQTSEKKTSHGLFNKIFISPRNSCLIFTPSSFSWKFSSAFRHFLHSLFPKLSKKVASGNETSRNVSKLMKLFLEFFSLTVWKEIKRTKSVP